MSTMESVNISVWIPISLRSDLAILAPTRVYFAMARDGAFVPALSRLHPRFQTPVWAIVLQSTWAIALTLTGTYGDLLNTVVFADWIFFGLTVAGLFVLRRRQPDTDGFRTPGFPLLPAAFVLVGIPSFAVLGVKWYENRMVEAEMADKMD